MAAGGNTIDPLDPISLALSSIGAQMVHHARTIAPRQHVLARARRRRADHEPGVVLDVFPLDWWPTSCCRSS